jgi:hypothetical protein
VWDQRPVYLLYHGEAREFFHRGALAKALNRTVNGIRHMEYTKIIPTPALRDPHGRWLYTRQQIEAMVQLAIEEDVFDPKKKKIYFTERFVTEAHKILRQGPK